MRLPPIWVVRDPSPNTEYLREVCYSLDGPGLLQHVASLGAAWGASHARTYRSEEAALSAIEARLKKLDKIQSRLGYYRHMTSDGRIVWASIRPEDLQTYDYRRN